MKMYQVVERSGKKKETYMIGFNSDAELSYYIQGKENNHGSNYSIVAWSITSDGYGYINLEKYWNK